MRLKTPFFLCICAALGWGCAPPGPAAYADGIVAPDSTCTFDVNTDSLGVSGLYDIAISGTGSDPAVCGNAYSVMLHLNSNLRQNADTELGRAEPNVLQIHSAQVRLMTQDQTTLAFDQGEVPLPNPFLTVTNWSIPPASSSDPSQGAALIETIPAQYAPWLFDFADRGERILAEIQVFGRTTGNVEVEFNPYVLPVRICDGCLTLCYERDIIGVGLTPADIIGDTCTSQELSGMDGRYCIDTGC